MDIWLWVIISILVVFVVALLIKIHLLQKAAKEIEDALADRLITDTNTLIDISTRDKYMCSLAASINIQLHKLCMERHHFQQGDKELKDAITNISHDLRFLFYLLVGSFLELILFLYFYLKFDIVHHLCSNHLSHALYLHIHFLALT